MRGGYDGQISNPGKAFLPADRRKTETRRLWG